MASSSSNELKKIGKCSLKSCGHIINEDDGRVDMRAFPLDKSKSAYTDEDLLASWDEYGCAHFHSQCWQSLINALKGQKGTTELSQLEKELMKEGHKTAEFHDGHVKIKEKAHFVASMLKKRKYPIIFTGAGISTAAGIGDFRGIFGKWTERDKSKNYGSTAQNIPAKARGKKLTKDLRPTYTHEAIFKLLEMGLVKFLISQNTDGLHVLSGVSLESISELHGNSFVEKCEKCKKRFSMSCSYRQGYRDPTIQQKKCNRCNINHRTGRRCPEKNCNGCLQNTIINFGDYLEEEVLSKAQEEAEKADVVISLGSTLQVSPANDLVTMGKEPITLVIVNRQSTPYDDVCQTTDGKGDVVGSRVFGDCDVFMKELMICLLPAEELASWENSRPQRMKVYDERRT